MHTLSQTRLPKSSLKTCPSPTPRLYPPPPPPSPAGPSPAPSAFSRSLSSPLPPRPEPGLAPPPPSCQWAAAPAPGAAGGSLDAGPSPGCSAGMADGTLGRRPPLAASSLCQATAAPTPTAGGRCVGSCRGAGLTALAEGGTGSDSRSRRERPPVFWLPPCLCLRCDRNSKGPGPRGTWSQCREVRRQSWGSCRWTLHALSPAGGLHAGHPVPSPPRVQRGQRTPPRGASPPQAPEVHEDLQAPGHPAVSPPASSVRCRPMGGVNGRPAAPCSGPNQHQLLAIENTYIHTYTCR